MPSSSWVVWPLREREWTCPWFYDFLHFMTSYSRVEGKVNSSFLSVGLYSKESDSLVHLMKSITQGGKEKYECHLLICLSLYLSCLFDFFCSSSCRDPLLSLSFFPWVTLTWKSLHLTFSPIHSFFFHVANVLWSLFLSFSCNPFNRTISLRDERSKEWLNYITKGERTETERTREDGFPLPITFPDLLLFLIPWTTMISMSMRDAQRRPRTRWFCLPFLIIPPMMMIVEDDNRETVFPLPNHFSP